MAGDRPVEPHLLQVDVDELAAQRILLVVLEDRRVRRSAARRRRRRGSRACPLAPVRARRRSRSGTADRVRLDSGAVEDPGDEAARCAASATRASRAARASQTSSLMRSPAISAGKCSRPLRALCPRCAPYHDARWSSLLEIAAEAPPARSSRRARPALRRCRRRRRRASEHERERQVEFSNEPVQRVVRERQVPVTPKRRAEVNALFDDFVPDGRRACAIRARPTTWSRPSFRAGHEPFRVARGRASRLPVRAARRLVPRLDRGHVVPRHDERRALPSAARSARRPRRRQRRPRSACTGGG